MTVDTTTDEVVLVSRPAAGAVAGAVAAVVMLAVAAVIGSPAALGGWLTDVGRAIQPKWVEGAVGTWPAALVLHIAVGSLFGALHAACQQRTAVSGYVVVGAFYGFLIWLIGGLVLANWLPAPSPLSTWWPGLAANLVYGLVLASWSVYVQRASAGRPAPIGPLD